MPRVRRPYQRLARWRCRCAAIATGIVACALLGACGSSADDGAPVRERQKAAPDAWRDPADRQLAQRLRVALRADPDVADAAGGVTIVVDGGRVTLSGWVPGAREQAAIGVHARRLAGIDAVDNRLRRSESDEP